MPADTSLPDTNVSVRSDSARDPAEICTLPPRDLEKRLDWVRKEILPHSLSSVRSPNRIVWTLRDTPDLVAKLDELILLEGQCCPGIVFEHTASEVIGQRRFEVRGVDPDSRVFKILGSEAQPRPPWIRRAARSLAAGTVLSLLICCLLPIAAAAILGAAVANRLAGMDQPWIIVSVGLLSALAVYAAQRRPTASQCATSECSSCP